MGDHTPIDVAGFERDGYVAVRGAFDAATAAACREMIWDGLAEQSVRRGAPATWRPCVQINCPEGEPFAAAGTSPALEAAYDVLIGPGRRSWPAWPPRTEAGPANRVVPGPATP